MMRPHRLSLLSKLIVVGALAAGSVCLLSTAAYAQFDANGWVTQWLYFGPLSQGYGDSPGIDGIRGDFLTDGSSDFESTILPYEGYETVPDFGGAALSIGWHPILMNPPVNWRAIDTTQVLGNTDLNSMDPLWIHSPDGVSRVTIDNAVFYGVFYVNNPNPTAIDCYIHSGSDDSCQIKIDDCEVLIVNAGRGWGNPATAQDVSRVRLEPGPHRVFFKVFNGGGPTGWRLRFADAQGNPITDVTTPRIEVSVNPADFRLTKIEPFGVAATRSIDPEKMIGTATRPLVTISVQKTYAALPDATVVEITESLPDNVRATNAVPAFTSTAGNNYTWRLPLANIPLEGLRYEAQLLQAKYTVLSGTIRLAAGGTCSAPITGESEIFAVKQKGIFLGDIVGKGTGRGDKPEEISAIDTDLGVFRTHQELLTIPNHSTSDTNGVNPEPVPESDLVDSVFFFTTWQNVPITSLGTAGPRYNFRSGDQNATSWDWILSNLTNDVDKGPGNVICGGVRYATGVGIHASSGVTFDLDAIRAEHGENAVATLSVVCGTDECGFGSGGNTVNLYIIYSDETGVILDYIYEFTGARQSQLHVEPIPPGARFLTFATGSRGDGIGCDHGVFAEARIFPELPEAKIKATPLSGGPPLTVTFSAADSKVPAGRRIVDYEWDFGDGSPPEKGVSVTHVYRQRGRYPVTLTITDSEEYEDTDSVEIQTLFASGDVSPWISRDVGRPYTIGGARLEGACAVVFGGGSGIAATADQTHLVYQPIRGDFTVTARITQSVWEPAATGSSRAGIMARFSTDVGSPYIFLGMIPSTTGPNRCALGIRTVSDGRATTRSIAGFVPSPPDAWFRIARNGESFTAYVSSDGTDWTAARTESMSGVPAEMLVGLTVAGGDAGTAGNAGTVTFCNLAGFPSVPSVEVCDNKIDDDGDQRIDCADPDCAQAPNCQGKRFRRADPNDDGQINITDGIYVLNFLFLGGPEPTCRESADPNDDGSINITDGIYILNFLFLGGPEPSLPGVNCGTDPAGSADLGCASYTNC